MKIWRGYPVAALVVCAVIGAALWQWERKAGPIVWDVENIEAEFAPAVLQQQYEQLPPSKRRFASDKEKFFREFRINTLARVMRKSGFKSGKLGDLPDFIQSQLTEAFRTRTPGGASIQMIRVTDKDFVLSPETKIELKQGKTGLLETEFSMNGQVESLYSSEF